MACSGSSEVTSAGSADWDCPAAPTSDAFGCLTRATAPAERVVYARTLAYRPGAQFSSWRNPSLTKESLDMTRFPPEPNTAERSVNALFTTRVNFPPSPDTISPGAAVPPLLPLANDPAEREWI